MTRLWLLAIGAVAALSFAVVVLVVIPKFMLDQVQPPIQLKPYSDLEAAGRRVYIANGCVYCHSQQVRDPAFTSDEAKGWGRPTVPADYVFDKPHLLGTMRTGPDLIHIGERQPSVDWHLGHLYQPRAFVPGSNMPSYPYLFREKESPDAGDVVLNLPGRFSAVGKAVVASDEARALATYLVSLKRSYAPPVEPLPAGLVWCLP